jgi:hypothetical protein
MYTDILAYLIIITDILIATFFLWRVSVKNATLWGAARFIYCWVAAFSLYHGSIYIYSQFFSKIPESAVVYTYLHPIVLLYMLNPLLIAIIHWRGGRLL